SLGDAVLGKDLFMFDSAGVRDLGPALVDELFLDSLRDFISAKRPNSIFARLGKCTALREFWQAAIRTSYLHRDFESLKFAQVALNQKIAAEFGASRLSKGEAHFLDQFAAAVSILTPLQVRSRFAHSLAHALGELHAFQKARAVRSNAS
ncbi:MAG: hypothetical protein M3N19_10845, partial [Candidatus Eremiobacteraeota bacterium]|nr:hypothetical protein [Candidatus Eremiobacteraeota bacterium]